MLVVTIICYSCLSTSSSSHFLQVPNNYETDLIYPIIQKASELANVTYDTADNQSKTNLKVCTIVETNI